MLLVLSLIASLSSVASHAAQITEPPRLVPFFSTVDEGPSFFVECRNDSAQSISSGATVWPFARAVRLDGNVVEEEGGRIGPGLTRAVAPGDIWRGIITLRQSREGGGPAVAFGAMVRSARILPLSPGRHTIAVQCGDIWSGDIPFYWEPQTRDDR
jgi:hypothetical protein